MPAPIAKVVMRIGRKRVSAASRRAAWNSTPLSRSWLANSTMRMPFLAARPMMVTRPTLKYTSFGIPTNVAAATAPSAPIGTISSTDMGIFQLS